MKSSGECQAKDIPVRIVCSFRVLQPDNIKQLKKMKQFPLQFESDSRHPGGDGQNCTDTVNNKEKSDGSEGEEDSDDDLPMIMNRIQVEYSDSSSGSTFIFLPNLPYCLT